jgi:hypothetical protein
MAIFPSGIPFPEQYYANYPGDFYIPLNRYVWGANITYDVKEKMVNKMIEIRPDIVEKLFMDDNIDKFMLILKYSKFNLDSINSLFC